MSEWEEESISKWEEENMSEWDVSEEVKVTVTVNGRPAESAPASSLLSAIVVSRSQAAGLSKVSVYDQDGRELQRVDGGKTLAFLGISSLVLKAKDDRAAI